SLLSFSEGQISANLSSVEGQTGPRAGSTPPHTGPRFTGLQDCTRTRNRLCQADHRGETPRPCWSRQDRVIRVGRLYANVLRICPPLRAGAPGTENDDADERTRERQRHVFLCIPQITLLAVV